MKQWIVIMLLWPSLALSQVGDLLKTTAVTMLGAGTALLAHEGGHQIGAWATDTSMSWHAPFDGTWHAEDKEEIAAIVLSGWALEGLGAEALLASPLEKHNAFLQGYVNYYIIHMTQYTIRSAFTHGGYRDFHEFTHSERTLLSVGLGIHLALVAYRSWRPDGLPTYLHATFDGLEWRW